MAIPSDMKYPTAATKTAWQKGKTLADKAGAKTKTTGLGEALAAAETAWKKIPFGTLVAAPGKIKSLEAARAALKAADAIINDTDGAVAKAWEAIRDARDKAETTKGNKNLSKDSVKAATAAFSALGSLLMRRGDFSTDDFENVVETWEKKAREAYVRASGQLSEVVFKFNSGEVATAAAGVWNKKELKTSGTVWKKGKAKDYLGKTLTVTARQAGDDHAVDKVSGQTNTPQAKFINDLKLISADGSAALLKP
ncbi:MAG: hypothetical protein IT317_15630 [Anaerolineales bacterium]|nr:hypothetical protein [Anaerolineales bacterium]